MLGYDDIDNNNNVNSQQSQTSISFNRSLSNLCALVAGFSTVFLAQVSIPNSEYVVGGSVTITFFAVLATIVICLNIVALTLLIVQSANHHDKVNNISNIELNNNNSITTIRHDESHISVLPYRLFLISLPLLLAEVGLLGFLQFHSSNIAPYIIVSIAGLCAIVASLYAVPKYRLSNKNKSFNNNNNIHTLNNNINNDIRMKANG